MPQIIGQSDSTKIGKYKVVIEQATTNAMQPNTNQHHIFIKPKRIRSAFTTEQISYLEKQFKKFSYINGEQRKQVATFLKMSERAVKIWFQNRRMKEKRDGHKQFDNETTGTKEFGDQFNNVPVLSSTNDQCSYSLPVLSSIADTAVVANTVYTKANKVDRKEKIATNSDNYKKVNFDSKTVDPKVNHYKEAVNQEYLSPYFHQTLTNRTTLPLTTDMTNKKPFQERKSSTSAEFSINLCKKYKQYTATDAADYGSTAYEDLKKKKSEPRQQFKRKTNYCSIPNDHKTNVNKKQTYESSHNQANFNNPAYYPVMPSVYAPPFMSPGGVLWKPVNFMPLMATNPPQLVIPNHQGSLAQQDNNCQCNCHGSAQHVPTTVPPSLQNPYAQYVITVPFAQTSPKF